MWTFDMHGCVQCSRAKGCSDRKALLSVLSPLQAELNTNETDDSPHGAVIVACKSKQVVAQPQG